MKITAFNAQGCPTVQKPRLGKRRFTIRFINDSGSFQIVPERKANRLIGPPKRYLSATANRTGSVGPPFPLTIRAAGVARVDTGGLVGIWNGGEWSPGSCSGKIQNP